jgi:double-stranded uracil-DNA glycosylase
MLRGLSPFLQVVTTRRRSSQNLHKRGQAPLSKRLPLLRDCVRPGVGVLFVGINPGLRSAETGHHFAGYSNRFWKLLHESGLVPEPITYLDDRRLPEWAFGITNIVPRATSGIDELSREDYRAGAQVLLRKIRHFKPKVVALIGVTVWRALLEALGERELRKRPVVLGFQKLTIEGARVAVLPNPSGRNATLRYGQMLEAFCELRLGAYGEG